MWGVDLYPTPVEVIEKMLSTVNVSGKVVLEPSAGTGNLVDYCKDAGAKDVLFCEIDGRLAKLLSYKARYLDSDFLNVTAEQVSHVDVIVMNPPFSSQEKHMLHAWDIAPAGCTIISLCSYAMLDNRYSRNRNQIEEIVKQFGNSENFGRCFDSAERKTDIEIGCVWLYKPGTGENEFDGYFDLYDYEQDEINGSGIVRYDFVQDIVSRYVEAVSLFDDVDAASKRINQAIDGVTSNFNISFGARSYGRDNNYKDIDRQSFKKELQKAAWRRLFGMMKMEKYVTTGVMADINKFVEQQTHVPFTVKNVYLMIQMIAGTHSGRMDKVLCEAFDKICSFSYENSTAGEGWRTNTDFLINKKFILPHVCEYDTRWPTTTVNISYSRGADKLNDIVKALCNLTGKNYDEEIDLSAWIQYKYHFRNVETKQLVDGYDNRFREYELNRALDRLAELNRNCNKYEIVELNNEWGEWIEWSFFRVKGFKKGTMHFEFQDENLWRKFNQRVAEIRGWKNMVPHSKKGRTKKGK